MKRFILRRFLLFGWFWMAWHLFASAQNMRVIDSLEQCLKRATADTQRIDIMDQLVTHYMRFNMAQTQQYFDQLLALTEQPWPDVHSWAKRRARIKYQYGNYLVRLSDAPGALLHFEEALSHYQKISSIRGLGDVNNGIAAVYHMLDDTAKARAFMEESIRYYQQAGFRQGLVVVKMNLAELFSFSHRYQEAINGLHAIEKWINEPGFESHYTTFYANLGKNYAAIDSLEKGRYYIEKALNALPRSGDLRIFCILSNHLANIYILLGAYDKAQAYAEKGLEAAQKINAPWAMLGCSENLQQIFMHKAAQAQNLAEKDSFYLKAFYYNSWTKAAGDSILNTEKTAQLAQFQARYETEKKEREISQLSAQAKDRALQLLQREAALRQATIKAKLAREEALVLEKTNQNYQLELALNTAQLKEEQSQAQQKQAKIEWLNSENQRRAEQAQRDRNTLYLLALGLTVLLALLITVFRLFWQKKSAQQKIERQNEALEAASRFKSIFLSNMSHEIRTPLSTIIGVADLLKDTPLNKKQAELSAILGLAAQNLLSVINEVLDFSKIEAGKIELRPETFDLYQLLHEQVSVLGVSAAQKNLPLQLNIDPLTPRYITTDRSRLNQILLNLLSNAIKFTPKGSVHLAAQPAQIDGQTAVQWTITDTGVGIAPEELPFIFDAFRQAGHATHLQQSGTGLGLAICKQLVNLQGGLIEAVSEPGKGSSFIVTLPVQVAEAQSATSPALNAPPLLPPCQILLVEDNALNQMLAGELLRKIIDQPQILVANHGKEALDRLQQAEFDLILMDIKMPEMDGYAATRALRDLGIQTPVIALTANANADERAQCLAVGMNDYLSKPIDLYALHHCIARYHPGGGERSV